MNIGLIMSAIFFVFVALAAIVGYSKGKKYVWQYTLTRLIINVTAAIIAIPLTKTVSEIIVNKLQDKILSGSSEGILASLNVAIDVAKAIAAMMIGLFLFFFVRLIVKFILKLFAPTVSSLLISLSSIVTKNRAKKKAKKEIAAIEAANEIFNTAEGVGEAPENAEISAVAEDVSAAKEAPAQESGIIREEPSYYKDSKQNGCYALKPQLLSILIGIVGCVFGVVVVFAPFTGVIGLVDKIVTSIDTAELEKADIVISEELYSTASEITGNPAVKFANAFGGSLIFNSLTTTKVNGTKISLKNEVNLVSAIVENASSILKEDAQKAEQLDAVKDILDAFESSDIIPLILADVINQAAITLEDGEEFMGITPPSSDVGELVQGPKDMLISELILSFKGATSESVKRDIRSLGTIASAVINHEALEAIKSNPKSLLSEEALIKDVLTALFSNDTLSSLVSTVIEIGINVLEDTLGMTDSLEAPYNALKADLNAIGKSLSDAKMSEAVKAALINRGIDVTDSGASAVAAALKTSSASDALASVEINKNGAKTAVNLSTLEAFEQHSLLISKSEVVISRKGSVTNPAREAELIADSLSSITDLADAFNGKNKISPVLRNAGPLLDNLAASELVGKSVVDNLLLVIFQSEKASAALPMNTVEITNFVGALIKGTNTGRSYESVMADIADMSDALSNLQSESAENPTDELSNALKSINPETAEALMHVSTPEFVRGLGGIEEKSSEAVASVLTNLFAEISTAKDPNGLDLDDAEYEEETEEITALLDATLKMSSGERSEELEVGNYADSIMASKILTNTVINSVYDGNGNVKIDPLNTETPLTESEEASLLLTLNEKLDEAENAAYNSDSERLAAIAETERLVIAIAAYMNAEVEITDGTVVSKN